MIVRYGEVIKLCSADLRRCPTEAGGSGSAPAPEPVKAYDSTVEFVLPISLLLPADFLWVACEVVVGVLAYVPTAGIRAVERHRRVVSG
jgi:hypothetical protein